jgi:uncharacterized membrane protein
MDAKAVTVADAVAWFGGGWRIFMRNPGLWIVFGLALIVTTVVLTLVPFVGPLALALLTPVLTAGLLHAAREAEAGRPLEATHVFQGFKEKDKLTPLLSLGGIAVAAGIITMVIVIVFIGGSMMAAMQHERFSAHAPAIGFGALIGLVLALTVQTVALMALLYATPLVMFRGTAVGAALRSSFRACLRNWLPLLVFGILYFVVAALASVPFLLGWILLLPMSVAMLYCSYRDLYGAE